MIGISTGVLGKISYEIYMQRTITIVQWCAIVGLSIFVGYLTSVICMENGWVTQSQYIVPIATLLGEKIVVYLFQNHKKILTSFLTYITPKNNE
jgi:hypothetical protein